MPAPGGRVQLAAPHSRRARRQPSRPPGRALQVQHRSRPAPLKSNRSRPPCRTARNPSLPKDQPHANVASPLSSATLRSPGGRSSALDDALQTHPAGLATCVDRPRWRARKEAGRRWRPRSPRTLRPEWHLRPQSTLSLARFTVYASLGEQPVAPGMCHRPAIRISVSMPGLTHCHAPLASATRIDHRLSKDAECLKNR